MQNNFIHNARLKTDLRHIWYQLLLEVVIQYHHYQEEGFCILQQIFKVKETGISECQTESTIKTMQPLNQHSANQATNNNCLQQQSHSISNSYFMKPRCSSLELT